MIATYATLAEAKRELKAENTAGDDVLLGYVRDVSRRIDMTMSKRSRWPFFMPWLAARYVPLDGRLINSRWNTLQLAVGGVQQHLLAYTALTANDTDVYASSAAYPTGTSPIQALRLTTAGCSWYQYACSTEPPQALITGTWGYHSDYANAWSTLDSLQAGIDDSTETLTVGDVDGTDDWGLTPRFSRGALLKIDDELMVAKDTDTAANTISVARGAHGSTAAAHDSGAAVAVFQVEDPIRRVTARQAALLYARQGAFQQKEFDGVGVVSYPTDLLSELRNVLTEYMYV